MNSLTQDESKNLSDRLDKIIDKAESLRSIIESDVDITEQDLLIYSSLTTEIMSKLSEWRRSLNTYAKR